MKIVIGLIVSIVMFIGGSIAIERVLVSNVPFTDMLPVHSGCSAFYEGLNPYDENVTSRIQATIQTYWTDYDPTDPRFDEHRFAYPAHTCLVLSPIFLIPYDIAVSPWIMFNLLLFMLLPIVFQRYIAHIHRTPVWQVIFIVTISLFFWRYSMVTLVLAQYVGWILLCLTGAIWALATQRNYWLALFLAGLTIRTGGAFFVIVILLYVLYERRYRVLAMLIGTMLALWVGTITIINDIWIFDFLNRLTEYTTYREDAAEWIPFRLGVPLGSMIAIFVAGAGFYILQNVWQENRQTRIVWSFAVIPLFVLLYLPQTNSYTLVYALTAVWVIGYALRAKPIGYAVLMLVIALMPWLWQLWLLDILGEGIDQVLVPALMMGLLLVAWQIGDVRLKEPLPENRADDATSLSAD
ncbi:MAG: hypothetical protein AAFR81_23945 [Chloroflexota bacterium]